MSTATSRAWLSLQILPHEVDLRRYLSRFLNSSCDIEDTVQDAYARLLDLPADQIRDIEAPRAFLFTTARNVALGLLRRRRVVRLQTAQQLESLADIDERLAADEELNAQQEILLLQDIIASLPPRCREVLLLRKIQGLSQKEIAARLGIAEHTVEKHVAVGVRLCAERMRQQLTPTSSSSRVRRLPPGPEEVA